VAYTSDEWSARDRAIENRGDALEKKCSCHEACGAALQ